MNSLGRKANEKRNVRLSGGDAPVCGGPNFHGAGVVETAMHETSSGGGHSRRGKIPHELGRSRGAFARTRDTAMNYGFHDITRANYPEIATQYIECELRPGMQPSQMCLTGNERNERMR